MVLKIKKEVAKLYPRDIQVQKGLGLKAVMDLQLKSGNSPS